MARAAAIAPLLVALAACRSASPDRERDPVAAAAPATPRATPPAAVGATAASVVGEPRAIDLAMAGDYGCARMSDASVRCWGEGPRAPSFTTGATAIAVGARDRATYACALAKGGAAGCWGDDAYGAASGSATGASQIAAGGGRACAVVAGGSLSCWGATFATQLDPVARMEPSAAAPSVDHVAQIAIGGDHACAIDGTGAVLCWGNGFYGQLGDKRTEATRDPVVAAGVENAVELSLGARHTCARTAAGAVLCWGDDGMGQVGQPGTSYVTSPHRAPEVVPLDGPAAQLAAGDAHTCARMRDGGVECWGSDDGCALGDPSAAPFRASPRRVPGVAGVQQIAAGRRATCAREDDGSVVCWGQLGEAPPRCSPFSVAAVAPVAPAAPVVP